jgi:large subunit ribosomal protein L14
MGKKRKTGAKKISIFRTHMTHGIINGCKLTVTDNSGAKIAEMIGILKAKTRLNRYPSACVGDYIVVSIKKGTPEMRKKIMYGVVVRQRQIMHRVDGTRICFEDNACIIISKEGEPKGTMCRGPVAKEAAELYPRLASLASQIV